MDELKQIMLKDLEIQWSDHFHMRDQTWKTLQYTILFFLGAVGLEFKEGIDILIMRSAYIAVGITSLLGVIIALHHRRRQKEKFDIIKRFEDKLEITDIIKDILDSSKKGPTGWINSSSFIVVAQIGLFVVSMGLLWSKWH